MAKVLGHQTNAFDIQLAAFSAALLGASGLYLCERRWPQSQEAIIGSVFVLAATTAMLLLAYHPQGGEQLQELLVGQVLWVTTDQLLPAALLSVAAIGLRFGLATVRRSLGFYLVFAVAVTASVQLVGVHLVFASLILPALATRTLPRHSAYGAHTGSAASAMRQASCCQPYSIYPQGP